MSSEIFTYIDGRGGGKVTLRVRGLLELGPWISYGKKRCEQEISNRFLRSLSPKLSFVVGQTIMTLFSNTPMPWTSIRTLSSG